MSLISLSKTGFYLAVIIAITIISSKLAPSPAFAQSANAEITIQPGTSTVSPGTSSTVNLLLNTHQLQISGFTVFIDVTGNLTSNITFTPATISGLDVWVNNITDISGGKRVTYALGVSNPSAPGYSNNTFINIGTLTYTHPNSGSTTVAIANSSEVSQDDTGTNLLNTFNTATFTVNNNPTPQNTPTSLPTPTLTPMPSATPVPTGDALLTFNPATGSLTPGQTKTISLNLNTNNNSISGFTIFVDVTGSTVSDLSFSSNSVANLSEWVNTISPITNGKRLTFAMGVNSPTDPAYNGSSSIGSFSFTVPNSGSLTFKIVGNSEVSQDVTGTNLLSTFNTSTYSITSTNPTNTPSPIPTLTNAPVPTATINPGPASTDLTVHLQGITKQAANQNLDIKLYQNSMLKHSFTARSASASSNGFYTVALTLDDSNNNITAGNYRMCVKAKSHLQRCVDNIAIQSGQNTINIADDTHKLLSGDVNGDNKLNIFDFSQAGRLYTDLSVPVALGTPEDVNHDGQISIVDLSLIIFNYPQKLVRYGDQ